MLGVLAAFFGACVAGLYLRARRLGRLDSLGRRLIGVGTGTIIGQIVVAFIERHAHPHEAVFGGIIGGGLFVVAGVVLDVFQRRASTHTSTGR